MQTNATSLAVPDKMPTIDIATMPGQAGKRSGSIQPSPCQLAHNAYGERVKAAYAHQTRYYLYDHQKRVAEIDEAGKIIQQYLYLNHKSIAVIDTSKDEKICLTH